MFYLDECLVCSITSHISHISYGVELTKYFFTLTPRNTSKCIHIIEIIVAFTFTVRFNKHESFEVKLFNIDILSLARSLSY